MTSFFHYSEADPTTKISNKPITIQQNTTTELVHVVYKTCELIIIKLVERMKRFTNGSYG